MPQIAALFAEVHDLYKKQANFLDGYQGGGHYSWSDAIGARTGRGREIREWQRGLRRQTAAGCQLPASA